MSKYPDIEVQLTGEDGNVFAVIGRVRRVLQAHGEREAADEFTNAAFKSTSYDEVLQLCMEYVEVA